MPKSRARPKPPVLTPYAERRSRKFLFPKEVDAVHAAAGAVGRYRHRDATLILMMYRDALRVSELAGLRWEQINFDDGLIHVKRLKGSVDGVHYLAPVQIAALHILRTENARLCDSPYVFLSSRRGPLHPRTIRGIVKRAGEIAALPLSVHPHMFRHACGYYLASKEPKNEDVRLIQSYLGHKDIKNTEVYVSLPPNRFRGIWPD